MLLKFNDFSDYKLFENLVSESIVYFSPNFRNKLKSITDDISKDLLSIEMKDVKPDITFIDLDKDDFLTFTTMQNVEKEFKEKHPHLDIFTRPYDGIADILYNLQNDRGVAQVYSKSRNQIKIGRLINKFFPDKYSSREVEQFVNKFKSTEVKAGENFKLVEGDEIDFWYDSNNYAELSGSLGNSCMRNVKGVFEMYTKNPDVCKMLILVENHKLLGRALVWKIVESDGINFTWFMDRQYTIKDSDVLKFRKYAIENNWAFKTKNTHTLLKGVTYKDEELQLDLKVQLDKNIEYDKYPYLDTFRRFDPENKMLYNNTDSKAIGDYILDQTDGDFIVIEDGEWSEYYQERIPSNLAIWSEPLQDWLNMNSSITVSSGQRRNQGVYPEDFDDIVWCDNVSEYYYVDDVVYSEEYQTYIPENESISVINEIESDCTVNADAYYVDKDDDIWIGLSKFSKDLWYVECCEHDEDWKTGWTHLGILKELMVRNYQNKLIPKKFSTVANQNLSGPEGVEFLTELDAFILDKEIDKSKEFKVDKFEYNKLLLNIEDELRKKSSEKIQQGIDSEKISNRMTDSKIWNYFKD